MNEIDLAWPIVHLNGSSKSALVEAYSESAMAVANAIETLCKNGPNQRDYYVGPPDLWKRAKKEHEDRVEKLRRIHLELVQLAIHVDEQGR